MPASFFCLALGEAGGEGTLYVWSTNEPSCRQDRNAVPQKKQFVEAGAHFWYFLVQVIVRFQAARRGVFYFLLVGVLLNRSPACGTR